jgi:hypothetical protein
MIFMRLILLVAELNQRPLATLVPAGNAPKGEDRIL